MMALAVGATLFSSAFVPPQSLVSRREMVQGALSAAAVGFAAPAFADGATSKATLDRSRAIYGSRALPCAHQTLRSRGAVVHRERTRARLPRRSG